MTNAVQRVPPEKNAQHMDIFVYGTLKKGFGNHRYLEAGHFVGNAEVPGILISLGGFPGLILEENGWNIKGEIWRINKELDLPALDALEGHPNHYTRKEIVIPGFGNVSTYEYNVHYTTGYTYECLPSGEWKGRPDLTSTAKWYGLFSKNQARQYLPSYGLYMDENTGFRAVVDLQTGEVVMNGGVKKPHLSYDQESRSWVPKEDRKLPVIITGKSDDSRNHGDLHKPIITNLSPANSEAYTPPPKPPKYVDPADPGEEDADGSAS